MFNLALKQSDRSKIVNLLYLFRSITVVEIVVAGQSVPIPRHSQTRTKNAGLVTLVLFVSINFNGKVRKKHEWKCVIESTYTFYHLYTFQFKKAYGAF